VYVVLVDATLPRLQSLILVKRNLSLFHAIILSPRTTGEHMFGGLTAVVEGPEGRPAPPDDGRG